MKLIETGQEHAVVRLSAKELAWLANTINETFEAVEDWELQSRVGGSSDELRQLQHDLQAALHPPG